MNEFRKRGIATIFAIFSSLAFVGVLVTNGLANALPLNGANTGVLSDEIPNLFVPAGLTFSIWGLIYLLLAGYIVAVLAEARRTARDERSDGGSAWGPADAALFLLNAAANIGWIFAWHWRNVGLAMFLMLVILGTLIALEAGNQSKLSRGGALDKDSVRGSARRFFLTVPLRVYLGWISVATIANATAVLVKAGWSGFGLDPRFWTVFVIAAGLAVALGFSLLKRQIAAPLVIVWAYAGIVMKRLETDASYSSPVWIAAAVAAFVILASLVPVLLRRRETR
ncbi:MAG TPA: hypothetical protein VN445_12405 [Rectinemataceae bacterium]|nr:hypothetical protein [Rectinemataceae bacterium]